MKIWLILKFFRNSYIKRMIRSAKADRILLNFKSLRKYLIQIILLTASVLCESYLLSSHCTAYSVILIPLFANITLDNFISKAGASNRDKVEPKKTGPSSMERTLVQSYNGLTDVALKLLLPELDGIEHLDGGRALRVAAYLRVSTQRQAKKGSSLDAQKEEMRKLARSIGASVIYWFIDAKSGVSFVERKLNAIYRLAKLELIDKVLLREIDRMGRESFMLLAFVIIIRTLGITTVVPSGELDVKRCEDIIIASVKTVMAEMENKKRTRDALSSKIYNFKQRRWNMPVPLGYRRTSNGWIEKIPEYGTLIEDLFQHFISVKSYSKVANYINNKYDKLIGKKLSNEVVARLLINPVYIGRPTCGKERTKEFFKDIEVEDPHLAFIDSKIFKRVQEIVAEKKGEYKRKDKPIKLAEYFEEDTFEIFEDLTFLCPICRTPMLNNGKTYKCPKCGKQRRLIKKSELEKAVLWIIKREKALDAIRDILKETGNVDTVVNRLREHGINMGLM
ncbi:MAG: recombinase family protein [Candidatus Jordarchaeaceae archaeon]